MAAIPLSLLSLPSLPVVVASVMLSLLAMVVVVQVDVLFDVLLLHAKPRDMLRRELGLLS